MCALIKIGNFLVDLPEEKLNHTKLKVKKPLTKRFNKVIKPNYK